MRQTPGFYGKASSGPFEFACSLTPKLFCGVACTGASLICLRTHLQGLDDDLPFSEMLTSYRRSHTYTQPYGDSIFLYRRHAHSLTIPCTTSSLRPFSCLGPVHTIWPKQQTRTHKLHALQPVALAKQVSAVALPGTTIASKACQVQRPAGKLQIAANSNEHPDTLSSTERR